MTPARWLDSRVIVTVGTGGVGKTTVAAALGLLAARAGKRVLVLTIDPARRLADALGTGPLDHEAREVPSELLAALGVRAPGRLFAMMLDTKRTFDELVLRYAPNDEARERILANPIYRQLTDALAGTREYSAAEKLLQVHGSGDYDLVVLDTPPASHALDFLDAPRRLTGFLDGQILQALVHPAALLGRASFRLFRGGSTLALKALERVTGFEFLTNVSEFLLAFESLLEGFGARAAEVARLLRSPSTSFVLVAGPDPLQARRAEGFQLRLEAEGVRLAGLVLNRVRVWPGGTAPSAEPEDCERGRAWLRDSLAAVDPELDSAAAAQGLVECAASHARLVARDAALGAQLTRALALAPESVRAVPLFSEDVHALESLAKLGECIVREPRDV